MRQPYDYGIVELSAAIPVRVQIADSNDAPTAPDAAPTFTIYDPDGDAVSATYTDAASTQIDSKTGFYGASVTASTANGFESGKTYTVLWEWAVSAAARVATGTFQVG